MDQRPNPFRCLLVKQTPSWFLVPLRNALQKAANSPDPILPIPWITGGEGDHRLGYIVLFATGATFLALLADCTCRYLRRRSKRDQETSTKQHGLHRELRLGALSFASRKRGYYAEKRGKTTVTEITTTSTQSSTSARQRSRKRRAGSGEGSPQSGASSPTYESDPGVSSTNQISLKSPQDEGVYSMEPSPNNEYGPESGQTSGQWKGQGTSKKSRVLKTTEVTSVTELKTKKLAQGDQTSKKSSGGKKVELKNKIVQVEDKRHHVEDRASSPVRHKTNSKIVQTDQEKPKTAPDKTAPVKKTSTRATSPVAFKDTQQKKVRTHERGCSPVRHLINIPSEQAGLRVAEEVLLQQATTSGETAGAQGSAVGRGGGQQQQGRSGPMVTSQTKTTVKTTSTKRTTKSGTFSYAQAAGGGQSFVEEDVVVVEGQDKETGGEEQFEVVAVTDVRGTQTDITGDRYIFDFSSSTSWDVNMPSVGLKLQDQAQLEDASKKHSSFTDSGSSSSSISAGFVNVSPTQEYLAMQLSRAVSDQHKDTQTTKNEDTKNTQTLDSGGTKSDSHKDTQTQHNDKHKITQTDKSRDETKNTQTKYSDKSRDTQTDKMDDHKNTQTSYSDKTRDTQTDDSGQSKKAKVTHTNTQTEGVSQAHKEIQSEQEKKEKKEQGKHKVTQTAIVDEHKLIQTEQQHGDSKVTQTPISEDHRQTQTSVTGAVYTKPEKHKDTQTEVPPEGEKSKKEKEKGKGKHKEIQTEQSNKHKAAQTEKDQTVDPSTQAQKEKQQKKPEVTTAGEAVQTDLNMAELLQIITQYTLYRQQEEPEVQEETEQKGGKGGKKRRRKRGKGGATNTAQQPEEEGEDLAGQTDVEIQTDVDLEGVDVDDKTKGFLQELVVALRADVTSEADASQGDDMETLNKVSLEQIKSLQEACCNLAREVDRIGLSLVTESVEETVTQSENKTHQTSAAAQGDVLAQLKRELQTYETSWLGVRRLLFCIDAHLRNAALYQMFHRQVDSLEGTMERFMEYLRNKLAEQQAGEGDGKEVAYDPATLATLAKECQVTESQLRSWGDVIMQLSVQSKSVPPVHMRTEELSEPVPARALCNYTSSNIQVKEGDVMILTDNSDQNKWKLETLHGETVEMPAICCVILPPDVNTMKAAGRLETQHKEIGEKARETYSQEISKAYTVISSYVTERESHGLSSTSKSALLESLEAMSHLGVSSDEQLTQKMEGLKTRIEGVKSVKEGEKEQGSGEDADSLSSTVSALLTITQVLKSSKDEAERRRGMVQQGLLLESEETAWEEIAEVEAPTEVRVAVSVIREKMAVAETSRYESAMGEVRQSFVITGVMDTVTEQVFSLADAIEKGIIDQARGVFIDRKLGDQYPIPVAMNAGYIVVTSTNTFQARELKRSAGIITVNFQRETRPFNITGVLDPISHDILPVTEGIERGIYNKDQRKYVNSENGEEMSLEDAIDCGAVLVEYDDSHVEEAKPEVTTKTFCITAVLDRKVKKRLTFDDAVEKNLLDKDNGIYFDSSTGQKYDLVAAMKKGYIRGTVLDDPDKIDQYMASMRGRSGSIDSTSSDFSRFSGTD